MSEAEFQPGWMTFEIEAALREIRGQHAHKKRLTILLLADAAGQGRPMKEVFAMSETCSETTWYGRWKGGQKRSGWRDDPIVQKVLNLATARANYCADDYVAKQIAETRRTLAKYGPGAVLKLSTLMLGANSESLQRLSALDILDRIGAGETASKATVSAASGEPAVVVYMPDNERGDRDKAPTEAADIPGDTG